MPEKRSHPVAQVEEVPPGTHRLVEIEGRSIGLYNVNGEFVAVQNVCPHEHAPVCRGRVTGTTLPSSPGKFRWGRDGEILACPWHGWEFDLLSGNALADPNKRLRTFQVQVKDATVHVTV